MRPVLLARLLAGLAALSALGFADAYGALVCLETCYPALAIVGQRALGVAAVLSLLVLAAAFVPAVRASLALLAGAVGVVALAWLAFGTPPMVFTVPLLLAAGEAWALTRPANVPSGHDRASDSP